MGSAVVVAVGRNVETGVGPNVDTGVGSTSTGDEGVGVTDPLQPVIARVIKAAHNGMTIRPNLLMIVLAPVLFTYPPYAATSVMVS